MPDRTALRGILSVLKRQLPDWAKDRKSKGNAVWKGTASRVLAQQSLALLGHQVDWGWAGSESRQKSGSNSLQVLQPMPRRESGKVFLPASKHLKALWDGVPIHPLYFVFPSLAQGWVLCREGPRFQHVWAGVQTVIITLPLKSATFSHLCRNTYLN